MSGLPPTHGARPASPKVTSLDDKDIKATEPPPANPSKYNDHGTSEQSGSDEDIEGYGENPFSDPAKAVYWKEVYENSRYECRHVFDPDIAWSREEEKKIVRKLDWHVCLWAVCVSFLVKLLFHY